MIKNYSLRKRNLLFRTLNNVIIDLPSPISISYLWNFGSLLGLCLILQIFTGVFLGMYYCVDEYLAFKSISIIMRDVNYGWLIRNSHSNGASMFFVCVYLHIGRGIYYGLYLRIKMWITGFILFFLMMATAFLGYVLPWGQMSFWGATVITNFFSAIPYVGSIVVLWLWGGFSVSGVTLNRFFSLHYLLPFIIILLVIIHIAFLHEDGSNNPNGIGNNVDKINFHPYYITKDIYGYIIFSIVFSFFIFIIPNILGDVENFIISDPLVTPLHIVPEWYFLFAYAILRAIPNKLGGLVALVLSLFCLLILPIVHTSLSKSMLFNPISKVLFWFFIVNFFLLIWLGSQAVEYPFFELSILSSYYYFIYYLFIVPLSGNINNYFLFK